MRVRQDSAGRLIRPSSSGWRSGGSALPCCPGTGSTDNFFTLGWLFDGYPLDGDVAPALFLVAARARSSGWRRSAFLLAGAAAAVGPQQDPIRCSAGCWSLSARPVSAGFLLQGFGIGLRGWQFELADQRCSASSTTASSAWATAPCWSAAPSCSCSPLASPARGAVGGDVFVVGSIGFVVAVVVDLHLHADPADAGQRAGHRRTAAIRLSTFLAKLFSERLVGPRLPRRRQPLRRCLELAVPRRRSSAC